MLNYTFSWKSNTFTSKNNLQELDKGSKMSMWLSKSCYWQIYTKYVLFLWIYNLHIWDIPLFSHTSRCYCELCTVYSSKYRSWIRVSTRLHFETNYVIKSSVCNLRITWRYLIAQIKYVINEWIALTITYLIGNNTIEN